MGYFAAVWISSRWPRATYMSPRRQKLLAKVNWYLQLSLKHITEKITGNRFYHRGGRYRQVSLYYISFRLRWQTMYKRRNAGPRHLHLSVCWRLARRDLQSAWVGIFPLRPSGLHFEDDIVKCILWNWSFRKWIRISLKFVPFVKMILLGDKPLSETMMASL